MNNLKWRKKGFTLAEIVIVCSIFAIMVIGIILGINRAFIFLNNIKLKVMATNFAREGVEMMYNLRDSNRRKCPGDKDKTWLYIGGTKKCEDITPSDMISKGMYTIKELKNSSGDSYVSTLKLKLDDATGVIPYEIEGFFDEKYETQREQSEMSFTGDYTYFSGGTLQTGGKVKDLLEVNGLKFYRVVRVFGIYCKNTTGPDDTTSCSNASDPKEMRFCVIVFYTDNRGKHASELCSIMTNFME